MAISALRTRLMVPLFSLVLATGCIDATGFVFDRDGVGSGGSGGSGGSSGPTGSSSYQNAVLEDRPLAYWPLDVLENGTTTPDISGNDHDALLDNEDGAGTITFDGAGATENATSVALANDASLFVDVPHPLAFGSSSYSLEAWVRVDVGPQATLWKATDDSSGAGYNSFIDDTGVSHKRYNGMEMFESVNQNIVSTAFRHIVFTYDHDAQQGQIYIDGVALHTPPDSLELTWEAPGAIFILGQVSGGSTLSLDEVAVYDHALTLDSVQRHYACAQGCE